MKSFFLLFVVFFSSQVFARQYIQCSSLDMNTTDVMVVNLKTEQEGTLFISSGMQNPEDERLLVGIKFSKISDGNHVYNIQGDIPGFVVIPSHAIGKSSNSLDVDLNFNGMEINFLCFARIYND